MNNRSTISGFILLDKPIGISSNRILQQIKHILNIKKAGYVGTLDPEASGMLPIALNRATRFSDYFLADEKTYETVAFLGATTTTGDSEGEILTQQPVAHFSFEEINQILQKFIGEQTQIPPMHAAIKHQGVPLYKLARKGIEVVRTPRQINIKYIELLDFQENALYLRIRCSKGTYIRTLVEMIGSALGCGAYVKELRRTSIGAFNENEMVSIDGLIQALDIGILEKLITPIDRVLLKYPEIKIPDPLAIKLKQGQIINIETSFSEIVRIYTEENNFIGLGTIANSNQLKARVLI